MSSYGSSGLRVSSITFLHTETSNSAALSEVSHLSLLSSTMKDVGVVSWRKQVHVSVAVFSIGFSHIEYRPIRLEICF